MKTYYVSPEKDSARRRPDPLAPAHLQRYLCCCMCIWRSQGSCVVTSAWLFGAFSRLSRTFWSAQESGFDLEVGESRISRGARRLRKADSFPRPNPLRSRVARQHLQKADACYLRAGPVRDAFPWIVAVPASLPEYEQIKTQAFGWLEAGNRAGSSSKTLHPSPTPPPKTNTAPANHPSAPQASLQKHHRPSLRRRIHRPLRQSRPIRIAAAREVRPIFLHLGAERAIVRSPRDPGLGIELSKHILDLRGVVRAQLRPFRIRGGPRSKRNDRSVACRSSIAFPSSPR